MEMNVARAKVMRNSRQSSPIERPEYFSCLCRMITNGARCTRDIKSRIVTANAAFYKRRLFFFTS